MEKGRFSREPWSSRTCNRCSADYLAAFDCRVDDEYHFLFQCEAFRAEALELIEPNTPQDLALIDYSSLNVCRYISICMKKVDEQEQA